MSQAVKSRSARAMLWQSLQAKDPEREKRRPAKPCMAPESALDAGGAAARPVLPAPAPVKSAAAGALGAGGASNCTQHGRCPPERFRAACAL